MMVKDIWLHFFYVHTYKVKVGNPKSPQNKFEIIFYKIQESENP